MRVSQDEKQKSHDRIIASAARLLRERGLEGTSVADVMKDVGMTHGGFYKHFDSKDALVEAALDCAFAGFVALLRDGDLEERAVSATALNAGDRPAGDADGAATYQALYLSREHRDQPGLGCPVAALGTELARGSVASRSAFGRGVRRMLTALAETRKGTAATRRTAAIRDFSMMVGAMVIARASDPDLADEVLAACRGAKPDVR